MGGIVPSGQSTQEDLYSTAKVKSLVDAKAKTSSAIQSALGGLSEVFFCSESAINKVECGKSPSGDMAETLCEIMDRKNGKGTQVYLNHQAGKPGEEQAPAVNLKGI